MSGHHPFSELTKNFPPERQARVAEKVQLFKQEMALAELRKARQQSQADLAARLQVQQPAIAKMEHRADMYVSNLRRFIEAMGQAPPLGTPGPGGHDRGESRDDAVRGDRRAGVLRGLRRFSPWPQPASGPPCRTPGTAWQQDEVCDRR